MFPESYSLQPTTSNSASPNRVAGPSTGDGSSPLHRQLPRCDRDEEIARMLQVAVDKEASIAISPNVRLLIPM